MNMRFVRFSGAARCSIGLFACVVLLLRAPVAQAQVDLTGTFVGVVDQDLQVIKEGPNYVDYGGIPLNDAARAIALSHTPEVISEVQRQCRPYSLHYLLLAAWGFRMWPTVSPDTNEIIAWNMSGAVDRQPTTIWMDGREPPADTALATPAGFTTGKWQGNTLVTTTTHLQDAFLTRNGVPVSEKEVLTMFFTRQGQYLLVTGVIRDPVYLTAPYVLSNVYSFDTARSPNAIIVGGPTPGSCTPAEEVLTVLNGQVPTYLTPQDNPNLLSVSKSYGLPQSAVLGGEKTMYPEYTRELAPAYVRPKNYCEHGCCDSGFGNSLGNYNSRVLNCPTR
jgi:hypothetical protein